MATEPVNLSGTVIRITSSGGKSKRPRNLIVNTEGRTYRIREYSPEQCEIGKVIQFRDIQKKMGGYWEGENIEYKHPRTPENKPKKKPKSSGLERRASSSRYSPHGSSSGWGGVGYSSPRPNPWGMRSYEEPRNTGTDLPTEVRDKVLKGVEDLVKNVETEWRYISMFEEYENPRPQNSPIDTFIRPNAGQKELAVYRILKHVITGHGSTTVSDFPQSWELMEAKRDLEIYFGQFSDSRLSRLKDWAIKQRQR